MLSFGEEGTDTGHFQLVSLKIRSQSRLNNEIKLNLSNFGISLPLENKSLINLLLNIQQNSSRALQNPQLSDAMVNIGMLILEVETEAFLLTNLG